MKWICYATAVLAAILIPAKRTDIGSLKPMEVIMLTVEDGILLQTDTEDWGQGASLEEAIGNLNETTAGLVYLDTVEYVLVNEGGIETAQELAEYLGNDVQIYEYRGDIETKAVAEYLDMHGKGNGGILTEVGGRLNLQNNGKSA